MGEPRLDEPVCTVNVDTFYIGKYEVTNGEFRVFADETSYLTTSETDPRYTLPAGMTWRKAANDSTGNFMQRHPVMFVSYLDATAYCAWLAKRTGVAFRLPTEAEWEKAARGKLVRALYVWGDEVLPTKDHHLISLEQAKPAGPIDVGEKYPPNGYGVFNMSGNVCEWTSSLFFPCPYDASDGREEPDSPELNTRLRGKTHRVCRGGSYYGIPDMIARRTERLPMESRDCVGFRVAFSGARSAPATGRGTTKE